MHTPDIPDTVSQGLIGIENLKQGDLIFWTSGKVGISPTSPETIITNFVKGMQLFSAAVKARKGGHFDVTHSGIVVEDANGQLQVVHVGLEGIKKEELFDNDKLFYPANGLIVFRAAQECNRENIALAAMYAFDSSRDVSGGYDVLGAFIAALTPSGKAKPSETKVDPRTYCSHLSLQVLHETGLLSELGSHATPRTFEAALRENVKKGMFEPQMTCVTSSGLSLLVNTISYALMSISADNIIPEMTSLLKDKDKNPSQKAVLLLRAVADVLPDPQWRDVCNTARGIGFVDSNQLEILVGKEVPPNSVIVAASMVAEQAKTLAAEAGATTLKKAKTLATEAGATALKGAQALATGAGAMALKGAKALTTGAKFMAKVGDPRLAEYMREMEPKPKDRSLS